LLRVENNAQIVRLGWSLSGLFTGRYAVQIGRRVTSVRWKAREIEAIRAEQARRSWRRDDHREPPAAVRRLQQAQERLAL